MYPYGPPNNPYGPPPPNPYAAPNPYGYDPYRAAPAYEGTPPVWTWFIVYAIALAVLYVACTGVGLVICFTAHKDEDVLTGAFYAIICLPLAVLYGIAPILPKKPWVWIYDIVLICLPMTSMCCLPLCVPLLIYWIKPEVKAFFQRL
jgi:hypothetical protein